MQDEYSPCLECDGQRVDAEVSIPVSVVGPNGLLGGSGSLKVVRKISSTSMFLGRFPFQAQKSLVSAINASVCIKCGHITLYANSPGSLIEEEETPGEKISREEEPLSATSAAARFGRFFGNILRKR